MRALVLIGTLALAACVTPKRADPGSTSQLTIGTVTWVSPRPRVTSGTDAIWVSFDLLAGDGEQHRMYMIYLSAEQFIPGPGAECRVRHRRTLVRDVPHRDRTISSQEGNVVSDLSCDTGSWSSRG